jgi:putative phage-type endonuclease
MSTTPTKGTSLAQGDRVAFTGDAPRQHRRPWGIGGSDIGAILGVSPYRSAAHVWAEKVREGKDGEAVGPLPMRLGIYLEPFVVQEYEALTGNTTRQQTATLHHPEYPELFGHVDRLATRTSQARVALDVVLECKTCSAWRANEWGPAWSDQVPAEYLTQCLWYLGLTQCSEAHLAVLLGNTDFRVYRIQRDEELQRHMFEAAHRFWVEHVLTETPPSVRTRNEVEALHPAHEVGLAKEAADDTLEAIKHLHQLQAHIEELETESNLIKDHIATTMGPAEQLTWRGQTLATWKLGRETSRLDLDRLRREQPSLVTEYTVKGRGTRRLQICAKQRERAET